MPKLLHTIEEYIAEHRKKDTIWIVFNTAYNDVHAFKKEFKSDLIDSYLNKSNTDDKEKDIFLAFMKENFPDTKLVEVFDLVGTGWIEWPYLGSIAIDTDVGSDAYIALCKKYGDPYGDAVANNHVLWVMKYDDALYFHEERKKFLDEEFGEE